MQPIDGAALVFARGSGGNVGFAIGQDGTHFYVLGGDKSDFRHYRADRQASSARCKLACNLFTPLSAPADIAAGPIPRNRQ